jgi:hypothetical protein
LTELAQAEAEKAKKAKKKAKAATPKVSHLLG